MLRKNSSQVPRRIVYDMNLSNLMKIGSGIEVFRTDKNTVGIGNAELARAVLRARPKDDLELSVFRPIAGLPVDKSLAGRVMCAVAQDIAGFMGRERSVAALQDGVWPAAGAAYLLDNLLALDSLALKRRIPIRFNIQAKVIAWLRFNQGRGPGEIATSSSNLAAIMRDVDSEAERGRAFQLYRRIASALCRSVSALITNAMWLGFPRKSHSVTNIVLETLRLLPPAWNMMRRPDPIYAGLDARIRPDDTVLVYPFLIHRDPAAWANPDLFAPERWSGIENPYDHASYLPFGHGSERCSARSLIIALTEHVLHGLSAAGYAPAPRQRTAYAPMAPLLTLSSVKITAHAC